jgi:asparagine synthase (glutamine-hydrolysing)
MPGIAGLIGNISKEEGLRRVGEMLQAMAYEPFYSTGVYADERLGVYAGWVVHLDSFCDCMPVKSTSGQTNILLDGEVFNSRNQSGSVGEFKADYLADLYEELGEAFFGELNGTFSGLVVDSAARSIKLFNDRLGFQKTYYLEDSQGNFYFSSEAKSLLRIHSQAREFDKKGLAELLVYGCTFGASTLYKGISLMPPASVWEFRPNTAITKKTYFRPSDWQPASPIAQHSFFEEFTETFRGVVPRYFTEPRTAVSITGGWDTRMILACLGPDRERYPCYTFSGLSRETIDVRLARRIAKLVKQEHTVIKLQSDFLTDFEAHAEKTVYMSDGYSEVGLAHELYLTRLARKVSKARVTGNFGSEILRGMTTFKEVGLGAQYLNMLGIDVTEVREQWSVEAETNGVAFAIFKEIPWKLTAVSRLAKSQLSLRSPFLDNEVLQLACRYPTLAGSESRLPASLVGRVCPELLRVETDRGQAGAGGSVRTALRRAVYSGSFKMDYLLTEGFPGFPPILSDIVSADYVLPIRHKYLEYRRWFRGPLRAYVQDTLDGGQTFVSGLFGKELIAHTLADNASGRRNVLPEISTLLTLELIDKCHLRQPEPKDSPIAEIAACERGF